VGGVFIPGASETSAQTQWLVDEEMHRLIDDAHAEVTRLLSEHRDELENLAHALLKAETLDAGDAYAAAGVPMRGAEPRADGSAVLEPARSGA
jgi:cell division protease FtsH